MSENPIDVLNFRAFKPGKNDVTVDLKTRFGDGERLLAVHFRSTEADILLLENKRGKWTVRSQYSTPISEASVKTKLEEVSQTDRVNYAVVVIGSGFELDLPSSLRGDWDKTKIVVDEPSAILAQSSANRVYMVHPVGSQYIVVSHPKQTISVLLRMVESSGLAVVGMQSSMYSLIRHNISAQTKDSRTILCNGSGFTILDQDETGRIVDIAQFAADNESKIAETLTTTVEEMHRDPSVTRIHTGGASRLLTANIEPDWEPLSTTDDLRYLTKDWEEQGYYHLWWVIDATPKSLPKAFMPVVIGAWGVLLLILGQMGFYGLRIGVAIHSQKELTEECATIEASLENIEAQNAAMMARRKQCQRVSAWIRGRENYQELLTAMIKDVPEGIVVKNVLIRENRDSNQAGSNALFTFVASVHPDTPMEIADGYFSAMRDRIAANGWFIAESAPGLTQIRIQATRRG